MGGCAQTQSYIGGAQKQGGHRVKIERYFGGARETSLRMICDAQVAGRVRPQRLIPTISAMLVLERSGGENRSLAKK